MRFIGMKVVEEYTKKSYVECTCFEVAVYEDEFGVCHEYYELADSEDTRRLYENVIPHTHCTPEFLADLIVNRYLLHVPNHREGIRMNIDKFTSCTNTRANWLQIGANLLKPKLKFLKEKLLRTGSLLNIDETWCRVRVKVAGDGTKLGNYSKKYIWVLINKIERIAYFFYDNDENDSRGTHPIENIPG